MAPPVGKRTVAPSTQPKSKRVSFIVVELRPNEEQPSAFVSCLASLASQSEDGASSSSHSSANSQDIQQKSNWARPPLPDGIGEGNQLDIALQVIDIDYFMDQRDDVVVRLFGVSMDGNSLCVQVHAFVPYFYVLVGDSFLPEYIERAKKVLNDNVKNAASSGIGIPKGVENLVVDLELTTGADIYGYRKNLKQKFLKVFVRTPKLFPICRRIFQEGIDLYGKGERSSLSCFEANVDFEIRFMVDLGLVGCGWVVLPSRKYDVVPEGQMVSRCQLECTIKFTDVVVHAPESAPEWSAIAPLRILSFDIECTNRRGIFPEAHTDAVIQIANMVKVEGGTDPFIRNCFVIGDTTPVIGSDIIVCRNEHELLEKWAEFVRILDPDIVTGYNIQNFDIPYIIDRAKALKKWAEFVRILDPDIVTGYNIQNFDIPYIIDRAKALKIESKVAMLGRVPSSLSKVRDMPVSSKQMGNRTNKYTSMEGRVIFDVMQVVLRDYKLRSYSLNSVSYHFLGEQKEDVDYSLIADLQNGTPLTRRRLAVYCMKDAYLPLRLLQKLMSVINYIEMARVTGVPLDYLLSRGQQVKVMSQLLRKAKSHNFFVPVMDAAQTDDTFEGATVIEPIRGFYAVPIATLDFASVYPSVMIAHNICYTTLIQGQPSAQGQVLDWRTQICRLKEDDFEVSPSNNRFVKANVRRGLLPEILEDLLSARKRAKADLKNEKDPFRCMVLNGRQLALKISANSVYGFTGATVGKLPCLQISRSVTAFGRQMIDFTKNTVEEIYKKGYLNGKCPCDAKVSANSVYGFTGATVGKLPCLQISQSVTAYGRQMIDFTKKTVEEIYKKGYLNGKCPCDAKVIYGDTDSVMVKFGVKDIALAMELGQHAAVEVSKKFRSPIKLEFEKVYCPFLLINKKRYAGLYFTRPEKHDKMDCKGLETVRRDNCPLVSKVLSACLEKMLLEGDAKGALEHAKKVISDLLCNRIDISELIISKELTRQSTAYQAKQAHVVLADRMRLRDAGSAPRLGDRVPYVIVAKGQKVPAYEKAEDPIYVLQNNIPIDTSYYLENQLAKPLARIFEPILGDKAESALINGEHTLVRSVTQSKVSALSQFFQKTERCLLCKSSLKKGVMDATCAHCKPNEGRAYITHMALMNATENRFGRLWTECQNCAGTDNEEILCSSRDCPIFYMREKVRLDLDEQMKALKRFNLSTW
uniref:DNA polymerase n=1 Tax=Ascaris lumbricoides TaxID=6252 RepID=A0A9J2Q409_ASCLU